MTTDPHDLTRFTKAQDGVYTHALAELTTGHKRTHWMWFIFPQAKGLGFSYQSTFYGIGSLAEATAYLAHPVLGPRLIECMEALLRHDHLSARDILGDTDATKLRSSLTLFNRVASVGSVGSVFQRGLERFFGGEEDERTVAILDAWTD